MKLYYTQLLAWAADVTWWGSLRPGIPNTGRLDGGCGGRMVPGPWGKGLLVSLFTLRNPSFLRNTQEAENQIFPSQCGPRHHSSYHLSLTRCPGENGRDADPDLVWGVRGQKRLCLGCEAHSPAGLPVCPASRSQAPHQLVIKWFLFSTAVAP